MNVMLSRLGRLLGLCNDAVYGGSKRRWAGAVWRSVDALATRMVMTEQAKPLTETDLEDAFDELARVLAERRA